MSAFDCAFYLLAAFTLISGFVVVRNENLFHAGIALISCFLGVAGVYVLLSAPFVGAMQVLIYAGAIAVVLLFAFMLTHDLMNPKAGRYQEVGGLMMATLVGCILGFTVWHSPWNIQSMDAPSTDVAQLAYSYMTTNFVSFQVIALLLLVSLVGAIVIARKEEGPKQ